VSERSNLRLAVLGVLVLSLLVTMVARLFFLQVVSADVYAQQAQDNNKRFVYTPATRGLILDQLGRPLVANRTSLVVSVDRAVLAAQKDKGVSTVARLAKALKMNPTALSYRLETCGPKAHARAPICWNGSPFQPVPVARDISQDLALSIMEKRSLYPGVTAGLEAVRVYDSPYGINAAHLLGYIGPVSDQELADQKDQIAAGKLARNDPSLLRSTDTVGRGGIEAQYDAMLRGTPGVKTLLVDQAARVVGTDGETDAMPGGYVVTNIDARLQSVVEQQLQAAILKARATTEKSTGKKYKADSGAALVVDVTNGHVLAMASSPSYDPAVWTGGISAKEYAGLTSTTSNYPLISRATQGQFVPASTFKIVSSSAALQNGYTANQTYRCPPYLMIGTRRFSNYEGEAPGDVDLAKGLAVSCDTMWYQIAYDYWLRDGGNSPKANPLDPIEKMAKSYGYGSRTGIDLPSETRGRVGGRAFKTSLNEQLHDAWCKRAVTGYPEVAKTNPNRASMLKALAKENCADGGVYRGGDEVNLAIGQGDTVVSPLQVAMAYAAVANGGTLWQPQVAKGVISSSGKVLALYKPKAKGKLPVSAANLAFLRKAFSDVTSKPYGTGYNPFKGFPLAQIPVAAKTGTGQAANGQQSTSWFATFAPATKPKYAVVMMVSQGGTGAGTSAPSVRKIYEAIYGVTGSSIDPTKSVLQGGAPAAKLPTVRKDGTPVYPGMPTSISKTQPASPAVASGAVASPATAARAATSDAASPNPTTSGVAVLPALLGAGLLGRRARRRREHASTQRRWWP
jgi:penicillin-binding protein 2